MTILHHGWQLPKEGIIPEFRLISEAAQLGFAVDVHTDLLPEKMIGRPGLSHYGLFAADCAELFIKADSGETYLEINLAPNGAYWVGSFRSYREPTEIDLSGIKPIEVSGIIDHERQVWSAQILFCRADILGCLEASNSLGRHLSTNFTAVIPYRNKRTAYYSEHPAVTAQPDFHRIIADL